MILPLFWAAKIGPVFWGKYGATMPILATHLIGRVRGLGSPLKSTSRCFYYRLAPRPTKNKKEKCQN